MKTLRCCAIFPHCRKSLSTQCRCKVTALLGIWVCVSIGLFVSLVQGIVNDRKREKREKEQASRDLEYHEKRMRELK